VFCAALLILNRQPRALKVCHQGPRTSGSEKNDAGATEEIRDVYPCHQRNTGSASRKLEVLGTMGVPPDIDSRFQPLSTSKLIELQLYTFFLTGPSRVHRIQVERTTWNESYMQWSAWARFH